MKGSVKRVLAGKVPTEFRGCARHWPTVAAQTISLTPCTEPHQGELIPESLILGGPEAPYPGSATAESQSKTFCDDTFQTYTPSTVHYQFFFPTPDSWEIGTHASGCWSFAPEGKTLPAL